jgi:hypothetical protein
MEHYVIISADCHAGPNAPVYRDFLDSEYRDDFEIELAERQAPKRPSRCRSGDLHTPSRPLEGA